jgi:hypothetical protein
MYDVKRKHVLVNLLHLLRKNFETYRFEAL